ncbi:DUF1642 domain-containing protein [Listeria monocytogenes]|uniref:DUF1642 domain-containing protein n=1 Tax=Listeria monocytogenes TaxID=1639 RepID=UPI000A17A7D2|nr:DUF1642 domain-containing protein [Listeria monocytogenes]ARJ84802.1 hypothetical protein ID18_11875 [Listeria monocytogenes]EAA0388160.1 DUF1642 domain-containing protein [Listeria monocytogenes]EAC2323183.1 DUF1642 domain-containing protein [Listeria monocytogenes]EAC3865321.1 DUF1642 domain-containing protein [Listeria monocytogenes]EAC4864146.1 DUF1642 domain-containing protein [Listeria monocytogenes]
MKFRVGDRVELILRSKKRVGTVEEVYNDTQKCKVQIDEFPVTVTKPQKYLVKAEEPELVVVPQFVADWISHCKQKVYDLFLSMDYEDSDMSYEMHNWLTFSDENQELFVRAWLDGYEVEKEPLYYVKLPFASRSTDFEKETTYTYIIVNITTDEMQPSISNRNYGSWKAELTEAQIKGMPGGDLYWQFAVLVRDLEGEEE